MKKHGNEFDQKTVMPSKRSIQAAGREIKQNPPRILAKTRKKFGKSRADKQRVAIMLSKARRGK